MSVTFTKLFSSITASTVWCEPDRTRLAWITMLAMADSRGRVWASIPGLASMARIPLEDARIAVAAFLAPDTDSRTKEHDGRRIEEIDGGWRLLNHEKYRAIRDEESIKESKRNYINARRERERNEKSCVENVELGRVPVDRVRHNAEAEAEAESDAKAEKASSKAIQKRQVKPVSDAHAPGRTIQVWEAYSQAYSARHGAEPTRNAKINGMLGKFMDRVPVEEAPAIAAFYVSHNGRLYVNSMHAIDLLLRDAEKLRTEWQTGKVMTTSEARNAESVDSVRQQADRVGKLLEKKE